MKKVLVLFWMMGLTLHVNAQRVTSQSASEALSRGEYEKAFEQYQVLLKSFPRDPFYLYGAGASLVQIPSRPADAAELLRSSLTNSSAVKSAPPDTRFYLARALHLSGLYTEAIAEYNRYASEVGKRESKDYGIAELIKECNEKTGKLAVDNYVTAAEAKATSVAPVTAAISTTVLIPEVPLKEEINKPDTIPDTTDTLLTLAMNKRNEADSLEAVAANLQTILRTAVPAERDSLRKVSALLRSDSEVLYRESDSLLILAGVPLVQKETVKNVTEVTAPDSIPVVENTVAKVDSSIIIKTVDTISVQVREAPIVKLFAIKEAPFYSRTNPLTISTSFPGGLLYTVQLAVFRNPVDPVYFKRLYPVFGIKNPGSELTYYYTGLFRNYEDGSKALQSVRNEGFKDAFLAIIMDGKPVSAERGAILAREWGTRDLPAWQGVVPSGSNLTEARDTVIQTLLLRVEVLRTNKSDNKQFNDEISRVTADKGFEILNPEAGSYVYIVGKFLTFESASAYADLLKRNGYKDARVVAYAGNREIPLETALKYFEK